MLPTVGADTLKMIWYASEVAGRTLGIAAMPNLVPDAERRAAIEVSGNKIAAAVKHTASLHVTRVLFEYIDQRIAFGKGKGVDRGFEATIAACSEKIRTSLPDRNSSSPDYRAIFPEGTEEYMAPTIKEDEELATSLRQTVSDSKLAVKGEVLALLDAIIPIVGPAAVELRSSEKKVSDMFQAEVSGRKALVDTLWEERKSVENALGRSGRGLARFIFFDFRSSSGKDAPAEPPAPAPEAPKTPQ